MKYIVSWTLPQSTNNATIARFLETGVRFEVVDETDRERIARFVRELERE